MKFYYMPTVETNLRQLLKWREIVHLNFIIYSVHLNSVKSVLII